MSNSKRPLIAASDLPAALGLMTRLPVPVNAEAAKARGADAAWAWPVAGLVVGAISGAVFWLAALSGLPALAAGLLAITSQILVTGGLHEDGLADSADGLWGGWTRERRLEIMRDSRIGSYGVLALILSLGLRAAALAAIAPGQIFAVCLTASVASRASIGVVMTALPPARSDGLSVNTGRPSAGTALLGAAIAGFLALTLLPISTAALAILLAAAAAVTVGSLAKSKLGGQTGDILGVTQQIAEIAILLGLAASL